MSKLDASYTCITPTSRYQDNSVIVLLELELDAMPVEKEEYHTASPVYRTSKGVILTPVVAIYSQ